MKQMMPIQYGLLIAALCSSSAFAAYSQKTFLVPRAIGPDRSIEYTTWQSHIFSTVKTPSKSHIFSHVQASAFYQESQKPVEVGKYFGIGNGKNSFTVGATSSDILNQYLVKNIITDAGSYSYANTLAGSVSFEPKHQVAGVRFDFFQDINTPIKKLFFKASLPIVYVQNDMHMKLKDSVAVAMNKDFTLTDFFKGGVNVEAGDYEFENANSSLQSPLTKAKIDGSRSVTGIADIDLALGYKLFYSEKSHLFFSGGLTIPTGKKPSGEYLFEPVCGNGQHFALNGSIDGGVTLWQGRNASVKFLTSLNYHYLFEGTEARTVGFAEKQIALECDPDDGTSSSSGTSRFAHYYLVAKYGQTDKPFFPAANVLTQDLRIRPGSNFDSLVSLAFKSSGFSIDLGYNFFFKDEEAIGYKNWDDDVYSVVAANTKSEDVYDVTSESLIGLGLNKENLSLATVKNPAQISNTVLGSLGYSFAVNEKYMSVWGVGGSYEFAHDNAAMDKYQVWAKVGMSF